MTPSPDLQRLIDSGKEHGLNSMQRQIVSNLLSNEASFDAQMAYRNMVNFLPAETMLSPAHVAGLEQALTFDVGPNGLVVQGEAIVTRGAQRVTGVRKIPKATAQPAKVSAPVAASTVKTPQPDLTALRKTAEAAGTEQPKIESPKPAMASCESKTGGGGATVLPPARIISPRERQREALERKGDEMIAAGRGKTYGRRVESYRREDFLPKTA